MTNKLILLLLALLFSISLATCQDYEAGETTTEFPLDFKCLNESCPANSHAFYSGTTLLCWLSSDVLTYCNGTDFVPYVSQPVPVEATCHGYIKFIVGAQWYWLNGTTIYKQDSRTKAWSADNATLNWFLGRLRPSEAGGWVYCSTYLVPGYDTNLAYYYNGSYFDVETDSSGAVVKKDQTVSQYSIGYVVADFTVDGCTSPVCCWAQDAAMGEIAYTGSGWLSWQNNQYFIFTGEFNARINKCAQYFNDAVFTDPRYLQREVAYIAKYGSVYRMNSSGSPVGSALDVVIADYYQYDPEARGAYYRYDSSRKMGLYQNRSSTFWVNIAAGNFNYQRVPAQCADLLTVTGYGKSGNPYPVCNSTTNNYEAFMYKACDPSAAASTCGANMTCLSMPSVYSWSAECLLGLCFPDYGQMCISSTTTSSPASTVANANTMKKYGSACSEGSDCFTGICVDELCTCNNCTKVLAGIKYYPQFGVMAYTEQCIPKTASIVGLGESCDMWAAVPSRYCGMGMVCSACPETWNSPYFDATCIPYATYTTNFQNVSCPASYTCGYLANCVMISGVTPSCTCPAGYNLEKNLKDCYGWKVSEGECSVTCGNGEKATSRYCDRVAGSNAECDGNATAAVIEPCLLPACTTAAVVVSFPSKVVTTELFRAIAANPIRTALTSQLNTMCSNDKDAYENQCCPGKTFPEHFTTVDCISGVNGVLITNEYTDGANFSFLIFARGDSASVCCATPARVITKRSTSINLFDQGVLASALTASSVLSSINSAVQSIDLSVTISADSIQSLTTTTMETKAGEAVTEAIKTKYTTDMSNTIIGVISGVVSGTSAFFILLILICYYVKKRNKILELQYLQRKPALKKHGPQMVRRGTVDSAAMKRRQGIVRRMSSMLSASYRERLNSEATTSSGYDMEMKAMVPGPSESSYPPYYASYREDSMRANVPSPHAPHGL